MEVTARAKNIRISSRKSRLVIDAIKGLSPNESLENLKFIHKAAARPLSKLIRSAIANAKHNFGLKEETLRFKSIIANEGPTFKRWRPVSRGRAHPILKRTSHLKVVLEGEKE